MAGPWSFAYVSHAQLTLGECGFHREVWCQARLDTRGLLPGWCRRPAVSTLLCRAAAICLLPLSWACHTVLCSGSLEATPGSHGHHTNSGSHYIAASDLAGVTLKTEAETRSGAWLGRLWVACVSGLREQGKRNLCRELSGGRWELLRGCWRPSQPHPSVIPSSGGSWWLDVSPLGRQATVKGSY